MAISIRNAGSWADNNATTMTVTLSTHQTDDMIIVRVACKAATIASVNITTATAGWTKIGQGNNGSTGSGNGTGSVVVAAFYKIATSSSETSPVIDWGTTAAPGIAVSITYQKGAAEFWAIPMGASGGDTVSDTSHSATIGSHVRVYVDDLVDSFTGIADDTTMTVPTITQAGVTYGAVTESPGTAFLTTTSNDMSGDGSFRTATAGPSTAAAVVTGTLSTAETGTSFMTRLRANLAPFGQAQAKINAFGVKGFGQANADIKQTYPLCVHYRDIILSHGPVSYWRLSETSGTNAPDELNVNAGTYQNNGSIAGGITGALNNDTNTAVDFNAFGYVSASNVSLSTTLTLEAWINLSVWTTSSSAILNAFNGDTQDGAILYTVAGDPSHRVAAYTQASGGSAVLYDIPSGGLNNWHHTVFTYDGTQGRLYIDGVLRSGPTTMTAPVSTSVPLLINRVGGTSPGEPHDGSFDEVAWYRRALSPTEVLEHYTVATNSCIGPFGQAKADIKATSRGLGQAQAWISIQGRGVAQANGLITTYVFNADAEDNTLSRWSVTGSPTIQSTFIHSGNFAYKFDGGTTEYLQKLWGGGQYQVGRGSFQIRGDFNSAPQILALDGPSFEGILKVDSSGNLHGLIGATDTTLTALSLNTWYNVDWRWFVGATTYQLDVKINGVELGPVTRGSASSGVTGYAAIGLLNPAASSTEVYWDDIIISKSSTDYPLVGVVDTFTRSVTDDWGTADTGGPWSNTAISQFDVNGSEATALYQVGTSVNANLKNVLLGKAYATSIRFRFKFDVLPDSTFNNFIVVWTGLGSRDTTSPSNTTYRLNITYNTTPNFQVFVGSGGGGTGAATTPSPLANTWYVLESTFARDKNGIRTRSKIYQDGTTSSDYFIRDDVGPYAIVPGHVDININSRASGNLPTISIDDLEIVDTGWTESGQAQASIATGATTTRVHAQTQADIKATYTDKTGQTQADIKATSFGLGQAQATIRGNAFGQTQADIKATSFGLGQAQADIKATSFGLGQAQADIKQTYTDKTGQAQADIKATSFGLGQAQADIKAVGNGLGQAQADVKATRFILGQAQADIKAISYGLGQAQADIKATSRGLGQAQADIKQTYTLRLDYPSRVVADGATSYWRFGESSGNPQDSISTNHVTIVSGTPSYGQPGLITQDPNTSIFSDNSDYLVPDNNVLDLGDTFSIELWLKPNTSGFEYVLNKDGAYAVFIDTGVVNLYKPGIGTVVHTSSTMNIGSNYHIVFTKNGSDIHAYLNGVDVSVVDNTFTIADSANDLYIASVNGSNKLNGTLDEIALYKNIILTPGQVATHFTVGTKSGTSAQAQADIKATRFILGQAQTDIKATYTDKTGQAQGDIKATSFGLGQCQADIKATSFGLGQAQADIKATSFGLGQAQADIKATSYGLGQAQADIKAVGYGLGQCQAYINAGSRVYGQTQAYIRRANTVVYGQTQADIKQTYPVCYSDAFEDDAFENDAFQSGCEGGFGQAQASISSNAYGLGQAQADIKATRYILGQAQADIKATRFILGQAQATIRGNAYGQCQAEIKQSYYGLGQCQADIKATSFGLGQAQATIRGNAFGQAQAEIKQTYNQHGQAQATIRGNAFGQAQADIRNTYFGSGQSNADIKQTYTQCAQSQASIKQTYNQHGQAQADIKQTYFGLGQCQGFLYVPQVSHPDADISVTGWVRVVL